MTNQEIIEILKQWNFWHKNIDTGFNRSGYVDDLYKQKDLKEVSVITGVRRSGKSAKRILFAGHDQQRIADIGL